MASTPHVIAPSPLRGPPAPEPAVLAAAVPAAIVRPPEPSPLAEPAPAAGPGDEGLLAAHGHWLWLLLVLPLIAVAWAWISHRLAYDEAGLPRGPRLRL